MRVVPEYYKQAEHSFPAKDGSVVRGALIFVDQTPLLISTDKLSPGTVFQTPNGWEVHIGAQRAFDGRYHHYGVLLRHNPVAEAVRAQQSVRGAEEEKHPAPVQGRRVHQNDGGAEFTAKEPERASGTSSAVVEPGKSADGLGA